MEGDSMDVDGDSYLEYYPGYTLRAASHSPSPSPPPPLSSSGQKRNYTQFEQDLGIKAPTQFEQNIGVKARMSTYQTISRPTPRKTVSFSSPVISQRISPKISPRISPKTSPQLQRLRAGSVLLRPRNILRGRITALYSSVCTAIRRVCGYVTIQGSIAVDTESGRKRRAIEMPGGFPGTPLTPPPSRPNSSHHLAKQDVIKHDSPMAEEPSRPVPGAFIASPRQAQGARQHGGSSGAAPETAKRDSSPESDGSPTDKQTRAQLRTSYLRQEYSQWREERRRGHSRLPANARADTRRRTPEELAHAAKLKAEHEAAWHAKQRRDERRAEAERDREERDLSSLPPLDPETVAEMGALAKKIRNLLSRTEQDALLESPEKKGLWNFLHTNKVEKQIAREKEEAAEAAQKKVEEEARKKAEEEAEEAARQKAAEEAEEAEEAARQKAIEKAKEDARMKACPEVERLRAEKERERQGEEAVHDEWSFSTGYDALESATRSLLIRELPLEWKIKVEAAMATKNRREVLATTVDGTSLSRHDFGSVLPQAGSGDHMDGWLNDEIVNAWMSAIVEEKNKQKDYIKDGNRTPIYAAYPSAWYNNVKEKGMKSIERWSRRKKISGSNLLECEKIYFPVNTGAHWMLLIICPKERKIQFLDSLRGDSRPKFFRLAREWLKMELKDKYVADEWTESEEVSAEQANSNDCGMFVCFNALNSAKHEGPFWLLSQYDVGRDGRKIMAAILLNGGFMGDWRL